MSTQLVGANAYRQSAVESTPPDKLLVMLYDGAIRFLNQAKEGFGNNDYEVINNNLIKAQDIVAELMVTLNMDYDISHNLFRLYDYFNYRLMQANIHKEIDPIDEVKGHLIELRAAWVQAGILAKQEGATRGLEVAAG